MALELEVGQPVGVDPAMAVWPGAVGRVFELIRSERFMAYALDPPSYRRYNISIAAKHSEGSSADHLYKERPDMFDADLIKGWGAAPSYDSLRLTDAHESHPVPVAWNRLGTYKGASDFSAEGISS